MFNIVGQCNLCGGRVVTPSVWLGIYPPVPTCQSCGATEKSSLPVLDMERPPPPKQPAPKNVMIHEGSQRVVD